MRISAVGREKSVPTSRSNRKRLCDGLVRRRSARCTRAKKCRDPGRHPVGTLASTTAGPLPSLRNATKDQIEVKPSIRSEDECHCSLKRAAGDTHPGQSNGKLLEATARRRLSTDQRHALGCRTDEQEPSPHSVEDHR
jgi:hypothetical protein